jgi:nicotinamidase/pyrazinamidase
MRKSDALLIIDLQPDFMPGGTLAVAGGDEIVAPIAELAKRFAAGGGVVVATQDWHPTGHVSFGSTHGLAPYTLRTHNYETGPVWPDHCVQGTPGAALHEGLPEEPLALVLRKGMDPTVDSYSAFRENTNAAGVRLQTGLAAFLAIRGVNRIFVCGLARDYCVKWTALDGQAAGFETVVVGDLTRSVAAESMAVGDKEMIEKGVIITTSAEVR